LSREEQQMPGVEEVAQLLLRRGVERLAQIEPS
jgi:hypothetical protein